MDTGNLGLSALAEGSIKCILDRWPSAEVILLGHDTVEREHRLRLFDREVRVMTMPVRFCKNVFLPYHFCILLLNALLLKVLPWKRFRNLLSAINPYVKTLLETDLVFDITGGDSFSDIYGMRRFIIDSLRTLLVLQFGKKLIMLPQTYGPFSKPIAKALARRILNHATVVYSRDRSGVDYVKNLLNAENTDGKIRYLPDVAFVLDSHRPASTNISLLEKIKAKSKVVVGLNINGLLFHGGYTQNNMFNLKTDYRGLIHPIIDLLMKYDSTAVLLVPHVFPPPSLEVESDLIACREVYEPTVGKYKNRIFLARGKYNHNESKYIIGMCDFFIGSRMHACIAALSQNIPVVGLAYSKKFRGVFETVGAEQHVVDMRQAKIEEILTTIARAFKQREATVRHLKAVIPGVQQQILNGFHDIS
ncbi:MAG: polysaccharide pyruvyl transferase family protein [Desulfobacteraceae bacterium]|nr:polysaccharide pyruvyl transferase family protein [Desulfobacteraceae bacterium]